MHDYFDLICIMGVGLICLYLFRFRVQYQLIVVLALSVGYVFWGITHHHRKGDLHHKIILEYIVYALLAVLIFGSILYRS
jgi:hypothetical protein